MQPRFRSWFCAGWKALFLTCLIVLAGSAKISAAQDKTEIVRRSYEKPEAKTVKNLTRDILSQQRFSPKKTFWQWLSEKLSNIKGPDWNIPLGLKTFIIYVGLTWCVLTLIAILIHLIWTLFVLLHPSSVFTRSKIQHQQQSMLQKSYEELLAASGEMAHKGAFREAIEYLMVALLRWLEDKRILRLHESKTNGDYLREYPCAGTGQEDFRNFVMDFDYAIYGSSPAPEKTYDRMNKLMENICSSVSVQPKI